METATLEQINGALYRALSSCLAVAAAPLKRATNLSGQSPYDIGMAALALARGERPTPPSRVGLDPDAGTRQHGEK